MKERVEKALDAIRPVLQADGGDVELVDLTEDGVVTVRLTGTCSGCPEAKITLQMGIEQKIREEVPEITGVVAVV